MIMNKKNNQFVSLLLLTLFTIGGSLLFPHYSYADNKEQEAADIAGFTYNIVYPDNQKDTELGYYDLRMEPSQTQELKFVVSNPTTKPVTIEVGYSSAKTNKNGVIEYAAPYIENDASLKYDFQKILTGPTSVELQAGETKDLNFNVKMPETHYDGVIAGGIKLMAAGQGEDEKASGGSNVVNQYAYVISVLLRESDNELEPDLDYNKSYAAQENYRNTIMVNFSNVIAAYVNDMSIEAQIMKKGSKEVLYEKRQTGMRMAPNSFIDFPISMNGEQMVAGEYTAHIVVKAEKDLRWEWTEDFTITEKDANRYNERDLGLEQDRGINWLLIILIAGGFILFVILLTILTKVIKKKKKTNKKQASSSSKKKRK